MKRLHTDYRLVGGAAFGGWILAMLIMQLPQLVTQPLFWEITFYALLLAMGILLLSLYYNTVRIGSASLPAKIE